MLHQTYLPSSSCSFCQVNNKFSCSWLFSSARGESQAPFGNFCSVQKEVSLLQPVSPPLQKNSHHRIQHYFLIFLGKVLKYMIKYDAKFDLSRSSFPCKGVLLLLMSSSDSPNTYSAHAECCWHYWLYLEARTRINTNNRQRPLG